MLTKKTFLPFLLLLAVTTAHAQFLKLGIKAGGSTTTINAPELNILDASGAQSIKLVVKKAQFGIHGGFVLRIKIRNFLIVPEVLLNSNKVDYTIIDINNSMITDSVRSEKYQYLDFPLMLGYKSGPIRLHAGPIGHYYLNSTSELLDIEGYEQSFQQLTFGWQAGVGVDLWKFTVDFRYEGNFSKFGNHIIFFNEEYAFDQSPARLVLSLGYVFGEHRS